MIEIVYNIVGFATFMLSLFCLTLTFHNMKRTSGIKKGWHLRRIANASPICFSLTVVSFMIFVSVIGTFIFPPEITTVFLTRTVFFAAHLLVGSFTVLWTVTKIHEVRGSMERGVMEKLVAEKRLELEKIYHNEQ